MLSARRRIIIVLFSQDFKACLFGFLRKGGKFLLFVLGVFLFQPLINQSDDEVIRRNHDHDEARHNHHGPHIEFVLLVYKDHAQGFRIPRLEDFVEDYLNVFFVETKGLRADEDTRQGKGEEQDITDDEGNADGAELIERDALRDDDRQAT